MKLQISVVETSNYCEDCGSYEDVDFIVRDADGKEVFSIHSDGHMDGGNVDIHDPADIIRATLVGLGHEVEIVKWPIKH